MTLQPGARLGPYEVLSALGAGGMGEVYRARDGRLGRDVAVKVLPEGLSADPERLQRFEQEARAAAALNHPNILALYDIGTHDGAPYLVTELLEGETLREQLTHVGRALSGPPTPPDPTGSGPLAGAVWTSGFGPATSQLESPDAGDPPRLPLQFCWRSAARGPDRG